MWGKQNKQPSADSCFNEYAETHGFSKGSNYSVLCRPFGETVEMLSSLVAGYNGAKYAGNAAAYDCFE